MANSTWTKNHLDTLLGSGRTKGQGEGKGLSEVEEGEERVVKVCPPCDVSELVGLSLEDGKRERVVLSLAQFRSVFFPSPPPRSSPLSSPLASCSLPFSLCPTSSHSDHSP